MNSLYSLPCLDNGLACHKRPEDFFCALPKKSLEAFNRIKQAALYPAHAVIFVEGQAARGIYVLCSGQAKITITSQCGKTFILRILKPGEILGLNPIIAGGAYQETAETTQPCVLSFVGRKDFLSFLENDGEACLHAAQHLSRCYLDACDVLRSIGSRSISGRLAKFLLESSAEGQNAAGVVRTKLRLTHEEISQLLGTSRETITRKLSEFKKMKLVELAGSNLIVCNRVALERLVATE